MAAASFNSRPWSLSPAPARVRPWTRRRVGMRSLLWDASSQVDRCVLPSMGQMINDQLGFDAPAQSQAGMLARYAADL